MPDELREIRSRITELERRARRISGEEQAGSTRQVGQVFNNGAIPTSTPKFFAYYPCSITAAALEGATASILWENTHAARVAVIGPAAPADGDHLIVCGVNLRLAADFFGGSTGVAFPGCPCRVIPATLTMTSSKPTSNNQIFQNATLVYGVPPSSLSALNLGANCYLSTAQFRDNSTNDVFWYYFGCYQGFYIITRVYATSVYSSPYRDHTRYRWLAGTRGNTCTPLALTRGTIYSGGDASCIVTITG
jgi:hypothetical protein